MSTGNRIKKKLEKTDWKVFYAFDSYGVKIGVRSTNPEILDKLKERLPFLLPTGFHEIDFSEAEFIFSMLWAKRNREKTVVYKDDEEVTILFAKDINLDSLESKIRLTVAEFAEGFVFLHAGAVRYKDTAIIIPAKSFSGKTTLVAELIGRGFEYYSDEYAVLDKDGLLHPFPKQLSMRGIIDSYQQVDMDIEEFGGVKGEEPIPVGLILISKYKKGSKFLPKVGTSGEGIIESIANSVSIRTNPEFVLGVLGKVMSRAKVLRTNRSEAKKFADKFLPYIEEMGI